MAGEPWNRVHIPFPSAVSTVRIPFTSTTGKVSCSKNVTFMSVFAHKTVFLPLETHVGEREYTFTTLYLWRCLSLLLLCRGESQSRVGRKG